MPKKIISIKLKKAFPFCTAKVGDAYDFSVNFETTEEILKKYPEFFEVGYEPEKFAVHTPTQADFDELMRLYEIAGWKWKLGGRASNETYLWKEREEKTSVSLEDGFTYSTKILS